MTARRPLEPEINVPKGAPLWVGITPEAADFYRGRPLTDKSGIIVCGGYDPRSKTTVDGAISRAGWRREDLNYAYLVGRPAWNEEFYRLPWDQINEGVAALKELITKLEPSIIIAAGDQVAYSLIPQWATLTDRHQGEWSGGRSLKSAKEIMDRRGFIWESYETGLPCPVIGTLSPVDCHFNVVPNRMLMDIDFSRAGAYLRGDLPRRPFPTAPIRIRNKGDLTPMWEADLVAYDIETKWGGDQILCIGFYTNTGHALLAYEDGIGACAEWLRSDRRKLAHNSQFDRYFLDAKLGIPVGGRHEDTICAHWALYPELAGKDDTGREDQRKKSYQMTRKGLNFLASFHLNTEWWKTYTSDPARMGQLCVNDVAATMWLHEIMEPELDSLGVRWQYEQQLRKLPILISIQKRGFLVDEEMRQKRIAAIQGRALTLVEESKAAAEKYLKENNITHRPDGTEYWWYHAARCECCFGGKSKAAHCDVCAGVRPTGTGGSIKKGDLVVALWRAGHDPEELKSMKKGDLTNLLPPCKVCGGEGSTPTWDFNPLSPTQMPHLLWELLGVPHYTYTGSPSADEETLKNVLEWAEEQK